ncbi:MAG TPA: hypothetical protein G4O15_01315 [Dehalococcoidia bacterium]|nr:hypothetical protein [Dehalococcoidia bacterium]
MAERKDVNQYILAPEIKQYGDLQVFEFHGKDARGYDFGVQLTPVQALPQINEPPKAVDADRVNMYAGGDHQNIGALNAEIEISMGEDSETYTINSAAMTYVPKGVPYGHRVTGSTDKTSWVLTLTLPPKYITPEKPAN